MNIYSGQHGWRKSSGTSTYRDMNIDVTEKDFFRMQ